MEFMEIMGTITKNITKYYANYGEEYMALSRSYFGCNSLNAKGQVITEFPPVWNGQPFWLRGEECRNYDNYNENYENHGRNISRSSGISGPGEGKGLDMGRPKVSEALPTARGLPLTVPLEGPGTRGPRLAQGGPGH